MLTEDVLITLVVKALSSGGDIVDVDGNSDGFLQKS